MRRPRSGPKSASIWSGSYLRPGLTCPPLRPDAPQPGWCASSTTVSTPRCARCKAADRPVKPPPTTATETRLSPSSGGASIGGRAVSAYRLGGSGLGE